MKNKLARIERLEKEIQINKENLEITRYPEEKPVIEQNIRQLEELIAYLKKEVR